jgi:DNA-binding GntR family transcriptional regulator
MRSEHELFLRKVEEQDHAGAVAAMVQHIKNGWREINRNVPRNKVASENRALAADVSSPA